MSAIALTGPSTPCGCHTFFNLIEKFLEKLAELLRAMARHADARSDEAGEERCRTGTDVVAAAPLNLTGMHRQQGVRPDPERMPT
jgi:hypothetical protein